MSSHPIEKNFIMQARYTSKYTAGLDTQIKGKYDILYIHIYILLTYTKFRL